MAGKKTFPAIFNLFRKGLLPENAFVTGYARSKLDREEYVKRATQHIKLEDDDAKQKMDEFLKILDYVQGKYDEDEAWQNLDKHVSDSEQKRGLKNGQKNRIFYMALPPSVFLQVATGLRNNVYSKEGHNRIVIEKPFGKDLESSTNLAKDLAKLFKEEEVRALSLSPE